MALDRPTKIPAIPRARVSDPSSVQKFIDAVYATLEVREGRAGSELDRFLSPRELYEAGAIQILEGGSYKLNTGSNSTGLAPPPIPGAEAPDTTVPDTPTGLAVTGAITTNILTWNAATYGNHAYTEIWRADTDNRSVAVRVGTTPTAIYADPIGYNSSTKYYWIRFVSSANPPVIGAYNATAGVSGTTQSNAPATDATAPGAVTGLAAAAGIKTIILTWTLPSDNDIDVVQVWRHTSDVRASATLVAKVKGTIYADPVSSGSTYYYWVRAVDSSGNIGDWNASAGVSGTTGQISSTDLLDGAVVSAKLADAAVSTAKLATGAVDNGKLAALAVDAAKLADSAVTSTKIANAAVGSAAIANAAIGTAHIQNAAIQTALIGDAQIVTAKIADLAITTAKIAALAVTNAQIADATIDNAKIATLAASKIQAGTITAGVVNIGSDRLQLDGTSTNRHILVQDEASTSRVKIGKLGAGATDYGIEIKNAAGQTVIALDGTVYGARIDGLAAEKILAGKIQSVDIVGSWISTVDYNRVLPPGTIAYRTEIEAAHAMPIWFGNNEKSEPNGKFYCKSNGTVVVRGEIHIVSGDVGGFTADSGTLQISSGGNTVGMTSSATGNAQGNSLFIGTTGAPQFRVTPSGALFATNATITGVINATSGTFTGTVNATSGSFTGAINATSGTFTGTINSLVGNIGGFTIGSTSISAGAHIGIDSTLNAEKFWIKNAGFTQPGVQIEYNNNVPRVHIGDGTAYIKLEDGYIRAKRLECGEFAGKRVVLNGTGTNEPGQAVWYDTNGTTVLATIGKTTSGDNYIGMFGSLSSGLAAVYAASTATAVVAVSSGWYGVHSTCNANDASTAAVKGVAGSTASGVVGDSSQGTGVYGGSSTSLGVRGVSVSNYGGQFESNGTRAQLRLPGIATTPIYADDGDICYITGSGFWGYHGGWKKLNNN